MITNQSHKHHHNNHNHNHNHSKNNHNHKPIPESLISSSRDEGGGVWRQAGLQNPLCVAHQFGHAGHGGIPGFGFDQYKIFEKLLLSP